MTLSELRAVSKVHGPLGLVHLDSHGDIWESYFGRPYNHGTLFRRALEEGLIDPARSLQAGMRGSLYGPDDLAMHAKLGIEMLTWGELARLEPAEYADRVRARVGAGPAFFTFDIDFVDPSYAPATGTPEVGGPTSYQALELVRALTGIDFRGFDVVEVAPTYDGPGQATSLIAANVIFEISHRLPFSADKGPSCALYDLAVRGSMAIVGMKRVLPCALALGLVLPGVASAAIVSTTEAEDARHGGAATPASWRKTRESGPYHTSRGDALCSGMEAIGPSPLSPPTPPGVVSARTAGESRWPYCYQFGDPLVGALEVQDRPCGR